MRDRITLGGMEADPRACVEKLIADGMTESEIAAAAGVSQPTINRIKTGKHKSTNFETGAALVRLARKRSSRRADPALSA